MVRAFPDLANYRPTTTDESASNEITTIDLSSWDISLDLTNEQPPEKRARLMDSSIVVADGGNAAGVSNQVVREENDTSLMKISFQRNIDDCFDKLMAMKEQHMVDKIGLKAEFDAKLEQMQRDYDRRVEELKQKCLSSAGF